MKAMNQSSTVMSDFDLKKRALFEKLLQQEKVGSSSATIIRRRSGATSTAPLSFAQERLWFLDQFEPNSALYNTPMALRLDGILDASLMLKALNEIVRRHEALRTRFEALKGQPAQVIESASLLEMPLVDLTSLSQQHREAEAMRLWRKRPSVPSICSAI